MLENSKMVARLEDVHSKALRIFSYKPCLHFNFTK